MVALLKSIFFILSLFSHTDYSDTSFLATFRTDIATPTDPIVFDYPVHNSGGHYNSTTGIYTVPLDGTYEIIFRIRSYNDSIVSAWLMVDGAEVSKIGVTNAHFIRVFHKLSEIANNGKLCIRDFIT